MRREPLGERRAQGRGVRAAGRDHDVAGQASLAAPAGVGGDGGLEDTRDPQQLGLDLRRLHPLSEHLELGVATPEVLQAAVRPQTTQVSGPVGPERRILVVGRERGARELRSPPVAKGEVAAAHHDLARATARERQPVLADHGDVDARHGVAHGQRAVLHRRHGREAELAAKARLGGAQPVRQDAAGAEVPAVQLDVERGGAVSLEPDDANVREGAAVHGHQAAEDRGDRVVDGDPLGAEHVGELGEPFAAEGEREQRGAVQQRAEGARDRAAEARGLQQAEAVGGRDAQGVRVPQDVVEHVAVGVHDALGAAGRSRREVDVGDRVRRDLDLRRTGRARRQVVDHEHVARRPGDRLGEIGGLAVGEDEASAQLVRDPGEVSRRIGCLQRRVGLAGPQRRRGSPRRW